MGTQTAETPEACKENESRGDYKGEMSVEVGRVPHHYRKLHFVLEFYVHPEIFDSFILV